MRPVNFAELAGLVRENWIGKEDLAIWGGRCAAGEVEDFLASSQWTDMPYRIWEWTDRITFAEDAPVKDVPFLERGRLFGAGGDLMLRREGVVFRWRYVGPPGVRRFDEWAKKGEVQDYWQHYPLARFRRYEETALLWGRRDGKGRRESRVAGADLRYPASGERIRLHYAVFSRWGRVEFVWYTGLSEWGGGEGGQGLD